MMVHAWFLYSCLFVALVPQSSAQWDYYLSAVERYLYTQLEEALVNDAATLEQLREVFFQEPPLPNKINLLISITADFISPSECPWDTSTPAFCPVNITTNDRNTSESTATWALCSNITMTWKVPRDVDAVDLLQVFSDTVVPWCAHGLSFAVFETSPLARGERYYFDNYVFVVPEPINLSLKKLDCHPYTNNLLNAVGQLISWIEVYTKVGGKPQNWDPKKQAAVQNDSKLKCWGACWLLFFDWNSTLKYFSQIGLVAYLLLTLSLSLLIPRLFLEYHKKLATKEISPGSRSLYWGAAVVCLFLVIFIMLGKFLILCPSFNFDIPNLSSMIPNFVVEILIPLVFFIISVIASRSSRAVPVPAAKFTTHVLFCCCCCFCCSSRYISKGVQVLTLWAFMTVIYYHIMEAIALVFVFFESIPLTISYVLMYVSGVFFAIMLVSLILFSCHSTSRSQSISVRVLGVVDVCAALLSSSFVMLIFVAFVAMSPLFSHLKVTGFEAVSLKFSLLPSLTLSVAGWFIRKKLLKEESRTVQLDHPTKHGATDHSFNDGDREERSPEEQQHFLA